VKAPLGFLEGVSAVGRAFAWLIATPRVWFWALWPLLTWMLFSTFAVYSAFEWVLAGVRSWYTAATSGAEQVLGTTIPWLLTLLAAVAGLFLAWLLTPLFSGPALEKIVRERERALGVSPRAEVGFLAGLVLGIKAQLTLGLVVTPLLVALWLLGWLFPPLMLVTYPMKVILTVLAVAFVLFDYPLTLRGMSVRDRWRLIRDNPAPVLGFGAVFTLLFWVPFASILLLPAGAAAAAELCARMSRVPPVG
jgi:CysZ protein